MCKLYSITTNQAAIIALFRVINRYVGNLPPMPGVFPDYPAPVIRNADAGTEIATMRLGMPPPPRTGGPPVTNIRNSHWRMWLKQENRCRGSNGLASEREEAADADARSHGRTVSRRANARSDLVISSLSNCNGSRHRSIRRLKIPLHPR